MYLTDPPTRWGPEGGLGETGAVMSDAAEYLRDRWADFVALEPAILDLMHRAAVAAATAREAGDLATYESGRAIIRDLGELSKLHGRVVDKMREVGGWIGVDLAGAPRGHGLGAIPVPVALYTVFAGLALVVAWLFRRVEYQQELVDALEAGTITAGDLEALNEPPPGTDVLGAAVDLGRLALWAFVAFVAWRIVSELPTFRRNPDLVIFEGNPPGALIGEHVYSVSYRHAQNSAPHFHDFETPGVEMWGMDDGTVVLRHPDGRPLWHDFD